MLQNSGKNKKKLNYSFVFILQNMINLEKS